MPHIITVTNQKGGVGKTTTCSALISGLTSRKKRVLGIDLDPQGNLGFSLGVDIETGDTIYEVLKGLTPITRVIRKTEYGDILPSNILLSSAELEFNQPGREYMLREAIQDIENQYDYIIIDTPPALNILTVNAYVASNSLLIPMVPEILSLLGISQLKNTIDSVRKFFNSNLRVIGVLLTKYNKRLNLTREVEEMTEEIARQLGTSVMNMQIRNSIAMAEAPAHGESPLSYAPYCNAALDYKRLVEKIYNSL